MANKKSLGHITHSEQQVLNDSVDPDFGVLVVELARRSADGSALEFFNPASDTSIAERLDITSSYIYEGQSVAGSSDSASVWKISRFDVATYETLWADGDTSSDNVWDDRATLSYS
jgi:hypothetical protein